MDNEYILKLHQDTDSPLGVRVRIKTITGGLILVRYH